MRGNRYGFKHFASSNEPITFPICGKVYRGRLFHGRAIVCLRKPHSDDEHHGCPPSMRAGFWVWETP